jgi:DNA processing protein
VPRNETASLIKLSGIKGIGEARLRTLISNIKPISRIFSVSQQELSALIEENLVAAIRQARKRDVEPELRVLEELKGQLVTPEDNSYPENFKELTDFPPLLYIKGDLIPQDSLAIAVVGTRRATPYGKRIAEKFAHEFALSNITVVSGLARGIDTCAHESALRAGGRTIAALGCGIDVVYPPENRDLMGTICENGACISEFPLGTQPWRGNFPARNRLISGLSKAVVVIEATARSGTFSTVEWALNQGREVFAVPGNITSETSEGVNRLIAEGAHIATSPQDVMEYLGIKPLGIEREKIELSQEEDKVWECLSYEPVHADRLAEILELPVSKALGILLNMELRGIVRQLPGRNFVRNV